MTVMTFKEYVELDEIAIAPGVVTGVKYTIAIGSRVGKEIIKIAIPTNLRDALKSTIIYKIAEKYNLDTIIAIQEWGVGLILDVAKFVGIDLAPKAAAAIFSKITATGAVTLGAILLSVFAIKNPNKAKQIYNKATKASKNVKDKLTTTDIKNIRKELKAA